MKLKNKMKKYQTSSCIVDWLVENIGIERTQDFSKTAIKKFDRFWKLRTSYGNQPTTKECFEFIDEQYVLYKRDNSL